MRRSQIFLNGKTAIEAFASMDGMMVQRLFVTMGDPAGVGPELALRAAGQAKALGVRLAIVGSDALLHRVANAVSLTVPPAVSASQFLAERSSAQGVYGSNGVDECGCVVIDVPGLDAEAVVAGHVNAATGRASLDCVNWAIDAVLAGRGDAVVTGPIHKEAWHTAGAKFPGHTELFAERAGAARHCMMLAAPSIRCALVTVHVGLAEVPGMLSVESILQTIELASQGVSRLLGRPARVAVLGLNPHAGEGGLFGNREEERLITPAIHAARQLGIEVLGPLPPDTAFVPAMRKKTDVFVCMYHDQGLIPLKALAFDEAVNVTLGLGIVRTSVDHGTALDIAWKGVADDRSMMAPIRMAPDLSAGEKTSENFLNLNS